MARTPRPVARSWQPDPALLDGLTIAAVALDADGTVIYANPTALDLFGSPFDKLVDSDARTRFFDEPERGAVDQVLKLVRRTGSWTGELTMLASGTSPVAMRTSWTPLTEQADGGALVLIEGTDESTDPYAPGQPLGSRLRRLAAVTSELLAAADVEAVSAIVTDHMMKAAGATVRVPVPHGRRRDARADGTARRAGGIGQPLGDVPGGQQRPHGRERPHRSPRAGSPRRRRRALPRPSVGSPTAPVRSCASRSWWPAAGSWAPCPCPSRDGVRSARPRTSSSSCWPTPAR